MARAPRVVLCAREAAAPQWLAALERAFAARGLDASLDFRDAGDRNARAGVPPAEVAIVWKPPAALFDEQPALQLIFNLGAGVDALLALPNLPRGATLVRLEDAGMADKSAVVVGVLGLGVIGGAIAARLRDSGFAVRGFARSARTLAGIDCRHGALDLDGAFGDFLAGLNVLVGVLPLTPATVGLLGARALSRLAPGAHLVNVGRGAHLVDAEVLHLLDCGQLGAATLDVFATEPLPPEHGYWRHPRVLVTPHVSAVTELEPAVAQIADKLAAWQRGAPLGGVVDFARGY